MDRLTYKHDDKWCISGINGKLISDKHANYWGEAIDRLAAYEETGFYPEALEQCAKMLGNINILQFYEWLKANNEGRLVVLPCKISDTWNWENLKPIEEDYKVSADEKVQAALWNFESAMRIRPNRITMGLNLVDELRSVYGCTIAMNGVYEYEGIPITVDYKNPNILEVGYVMKLWD